MSEGMVSVIPTYRPSRELLALVELLRHHGPVIISDDASPCVYDPLLAEVADLENVTVVRHRSNAGIARGLNDGLRFAQAWQATWLLTVDQDSTLCANYVGELVDLASELRQTGNMIGVLGAEVVADESGSMKYPLRRSGTYSVTEEVIQSGSLWYVPALSQMLGFDESLGNDAVDAAACLGLRERGYLVAVAPGLSFQHRIGSASQHRLLGRYVMVTHHSRTRQNAMVRNRLRLLRREARQSPRHAYRTIRRVVVNRFMGWLHKR